MARPLASLEVDSNSCCLCMPPPSHERTGADGQAMSAGSLNGLRGRLGTRLTGSDATTDAIRRLVDTLEAATPGPVVSLKDVSLVLDGRRVLQPRRLGGDAGRELGRDRPQRCGQDEPPQHHQRLQVAVERRGLGPREEIRGRGPPRAEDNSLDQYVRA